MNLSNRSFVSISDFSKEEILFILDEAKKFEENPVSKLLDGKVIATLFFEPSTRTRLSFEAALKKLGASNIGFASGTVSSTSKGESLSDTVHMVEGYADAIIIRHPQAGSAKHAAEVSRVPVLNAGDGANEHPTQTMLDLYSILKTQGTLDGLSIAFAGDLKYGRTVHSLIKALEHFKVHMRFIAPDALQIPDITLERLKKNPNVTFEKDERLIENLDDLDILYMTRIQKERFTQSDDYELMSGIYQLKYKHLEKTKENFRVLHPLPRVDEIDVDVDEHPKAYYFKQAENGVYVRQALLAAILT